VEARDTAGNTATADVSVNVVTGALVAAYGFNEATGTVLEDATGNGHEGDLAGQTWVSGKYGAGLSFDQNFVTVADSSLLDLSSGLTLSAWVRPLGPQPIWPTILLKESPDGFAYSLYSQGSAQEAAVCLGALDAQDDCAVGGELPVDTWTHLAGTFDGSVQRIYLNGELAGSFAREAPAHVTADALRIGGNSMSPNDFFFGVIDEVRIYARALTQLEIQNDMSSPIEAGACPANIDDGNPCTSDSCNPTTGIVSHTPVSPGTSCADSNACNGAETCNATAECVSGTAVTCVALNACHDAGTCNPTTGVCSNPAKADGTSCADSTLCNGAELCQAGTCTAGTPPTLDDGNPCTADACSAQIGVSHTPVSTGTTCADANACNGAETCNATGECVSGTPVTCVALDQCHDAGTCNPTTGACSNPAKADGTSCADATVCNGAELCQSGTCVAGTAPALDDGNPCTTDSCDPTAGAVHTPVATGTSCADTNACNGAETCSATGECVSGTPVACVALDACHDAGTCNPTTGVCSNPAKADGASCADATVCNGTELCQAGTCVAGTAPTIDDGNPCTDDACDPVAGVSHAPREEGSTCNDFDVCNGAEVCDAVGICQPGTPVPTDAGGACSIGTCDPLTGVVTYEPAPQGTECFLDVCTLAECNATGECTSAGSIAEDDGDPCTLEWCDPVLGPQQKACSTIDRTVGTTLHESMAWIFSEPNPPQVGVAPGTIVVERAAALRGRITTRDGSPLPGVTVSILGHAELGQTTTRPDGEFDFVVNGGGSLVVVLEKEGYLSIQRSARTVWGEHAALPDAIMIPADPIVTHVDLAATGSAIQVVQGSVITDDDGPRQGTLLVPQGTGATMHLADGSEVELSTMDVRITEFTVGPGGPAAMPAPLPPESQYTYAFEVNADQAVLAGAPSITFTTPLPYYVDNFLGFPAGTPVPLGALDRAASAWKREASGVVLDIVSESAGLAEIDVTGDGLADTGSALAAHSITNDELRTLAELYEPGRSLWRVQLSHFTTPYDCNWGGGPPDDAERPSNRPPDSDEDPPCPSEVSGASTIECERQVLREALPIAGTPFSLNYSSARVPGRKAAYEAKIQLSGASLPESVLRIDLHLSVAGRSFEQSFPAAPNQSTTFVWDGLDLFGRRLQGAQELTGRVEYIYRFQYSRNCCFGYNGNGLPITGSLARAELNFPQGFRAVVGVFDATDVGLGAWTLDEHHTHELMTRRLQLGSGRALDEASMPAVATKVVPGNEAAFAGQIVVAPDGAIFAGGSGVVWKSMPGLPAVRFAGHPSFQGYAGDGLAATEPSVRLALVQDLALGPDGSLYIADSASSASDLVRRVRPDGIIETFAGVPGQRTTAIVDGRLATQQPLASPRHLAVANDGTLFVSTVTSIVRVAPDGTIDRVAGKLVPPGTPIPRPDFPADGAPAREFYMEPWAIALDPQGTLYASAQSCTGTTCMPRARIFRFVDGLAYHVAGDGCIGTACTSVQDGIPAKNTTISASSLAFDAQGQLYFLDGARVRTITPQGVVQTVAGRAAGGGLPFSNGVPATAASLAPKDISFGPNGLHLTAYPADLPSVLRSHLPLPGDSGTAFLTGARDEDAFYSFDRFGRHLSTRHSLTGSELMGFTYSDGKLTSLTNEAGLATTIERDAAGRPLAIVAPFGQRTELELDANGYLAEVRAPNGDTTSMTYSSDGLLQTFTNARDVTSSMQYDTKGRLIVDSDPVGGSHSLTRQETAGGGWTVDRSTALGRHTTYATTQSPLGGELKTVTDPAGHQTLITKNSDQSTVVTKPDGTIITAGEAPDARLGLNAPLQSLTTRTPSGLTQVETTTRDYTGLNPADVLAFNNQTTRTVLNGRTWTTSYNKSNRTFTTTSPVGRSSTRVIDSLGRTTRTQVAGLGTPTDFIYDGSGRLQRIQQGGRTTTNTYFPNGTASAGYLAGTTDPVLDVTSYTRDALGRTLTETRAGAATAFGWDPLNNLTNVTPPGKPQHGMTYTPVNLLETYDPPPAGLPSVSTGYTYDLDRMLRTETRPTGEVITRTPDSAGRLDTVAIPGGLIDYDYYPPGTPSGAGKTSDVAGPYGVDLHYTYDGSLTTSTSWSGDVSGSVSWQYNNDFNKILETVTAPSGSATTAFGYDNDQLLTCASPTTCNPAGSDALRLIRSPQNGLVTGITLGLTSETFTYNSVGELATQVATFNSTPLVNITYHGGGAASRDALGRIVQKTEVIGGVTKVYRYTYDALRRLTDVEIDGVLEEHFEYDANGNRTLGYNRTAGTTWTGTYDDQDRLLSYGPFDYTYTANGELETKTNRDTDEEWLYQYDVLGNLLSVGLPDGRLVDYLVDGLGRRVGKKIDGVLLKQWVYRDALKPVAELDGAGNLVAEFVYGAKSNVPDYVRRGGTTYRVLSDHLGSPRHVVSLSNSVDVPFAASYTSFGEVSGVGLDSMPFGFAGGIYDEDGGGVRFGLREYDPQIGRWASKDPIGFSGQQANLYAYVSGDPINWSDPTGLLYYDIGGSLGGLIGKLPLLGVGGALVDDCGRICYYVGGGLGTPGAAGTIGVGTGSPTPGFNGGLSFGAAFMYLQTGAAGGSGFLEGGFSTSLLFNAGLTTYYVWCP
jgi:RHS repeat-associated protein